MTCSIFVVYQVIFVIAVLDGLVDVGETKEDIEGADPWVLRELDFCGVCLDMCTVVYSVISGG